MPTEAIGSGIQFYVGSMQRVEMENRGYTSMTVDFFDANGRLMNLAPGTPSPPTLTINVKWSSYSDLSSAVSDANRDSK